MSKANTTTAQREGTLGFRTMEELREVHSDLQRRRRFSDDRPEFLAEVKTFLIQGRETGVLLASESERYTAQDILNYWSAILYRAGHEPPDTTLAEYDESQAPELDEAEFPYAALDAFQRHPGQFFAGWQRLVDECLEKLAHDRVVAVLGPAGSGRSSLLNSGVVPALQAGGLPSSENWRFLPPMSPGPRPLESLAQLLRPADKPKSTWATEQVKRMRENTGHFAELLDDVGTQPCVVVVDQFEQIFTQCDKSEREVFVGNLVGVLQGAGEHHLIVAVRSDFLSHLGELEDLYTALELEQNRVFICFTTRELRQSIEGPAKKIGLKFDDGLVDRLLLDVQGDPAPLSLLQFSLTQLWEQRRRNLITWEAYNELGGGALALERTAEALYRSLAPDEQQTARRILLRMLRLELGREVTLMTVAPEESIPAGEPKDRAERVLERLIEDGIVRRLQIESTGEVKYRVAHEALVEHWTRLAEWLEDERLETHQRRRLTAAAEQWCEKDKDIDALWSGSLLREAIQYKDLSEQETAFVVASHQRERRRRWRRLTVASTIGVLLLIVTTIGIWSWFNLKALTTRRLQQAREAMESGEIADSLLLVANASDFDMTYRLPFFDTSKKRIFGMRFGAGLRQLPRLEHVLTQRNLTFAQFSPDGRYVITTSGKEEQDAFTDDDQKQNAVTDSDEKIAKLLDLATGKTAKTFQHANEVLHGSLSFDGHWLVTASGDREKRDFGAATLWDVKSRKKVNTFAHEGLVINVYFDPTSNKRILTLSEQSEGEPTISIATVWCWEDETGEPRRIQLLTDEDMNDDTDWTVHSVEFWKGPKHAPFETAAVSDGLCPPIVTAMGSVDGRSGKVVVWKLNEDPTTQVLKSVSESKEFKDPVRRASFSPDGEFLVTVSGDQIVEVWDAEPLKRVLPLPHAQRVDFATFSPDGRQIVTTSDDGSVRIWDVTTGREAVPSLRHDGRVFRATFSPDGRFLATASRDRTARVWEMATGQAVLQPLHHLYSVTQVDFSPAGDRLLTRSQNTLRVWGLITGNPSPRVLRTEGWLNHAACSADGKWVVTASGRPGTGEGTARVWNAQTGKPTTDDPLLHRDSAVTFAAFSPDGQKIVTVSKWQPGKSSPDSQKIATGSESQQRKSIIRVWNLNELKCKDYEPTRIDVSSDVMTASISADGARVVTAGENRETGKGEAFIYDTDTRQKVVPLGPENHEGRHEAVVNHAVFNSDGTRVVTCCADDRARIWNTDGTLLQVLSKSDEERHTADVVHAAFSDDGNSVVTASLDMTARIWDTESGALKGTLKHPKGVTQAWFSKSDEFVTTTSLDGMVHVWNAKTKEIVTVLRHVGKLQHASYVAEKDDVVTVVLRPMSAKFVAPGAGTDVAQYHVWDLSPYRDSVKGLRSYAQFIARRSSEERSPETMIEAFDSTKQWNALKKWREQLVFSKPSADQHRQLADACERMNQWFAASWHLSKLLQDSPEDPRLLRRRADAYTKLRYWEVAVIDYGQAIQLEPQNGELFEQRAKCYLEWGDWKWADREDEARQLWKSAIDDFEKAIELTEAAMKLDPDRCQLYLGRADARAKFGESTDQPTEWGLVAGDLAKALTINRNVSNGHPIPEKDELRRWYQLALAQLADGNIDGYQATCKDMLKRFQGTEDPTVANPVAWTCSLSPSADVSTVKTAYELLRWATRDEPEGPNHLNTLGAALYRLGCGRFVEAEDELSKSKDAFNYQQRMLARRLAIRDKEALKAFHSGLEDGSVWDWIFLAMIYQESGDGETAGKWRDMAAPKINVLLEARQTPDFGIPWDTRLELELLRDEMNELLGAD